MNIISASTHESSWALGMLMCWYVLFYFLLSWRNRPASYWNMVRCMRMHSRCRATLYPCSIIHIYSIVYTYVRTDRNSVYVDTYLHTGPHSSHTLCNIYNPWVHMYTVCVQTPALCVHTAPQWSTCSDRDHTMYVHVFYSHDLHKSPLTAVQCVLISKRYSLQQGLTIS